MINDVEMEAFWDNLVIDEEEALIEPLEEEQNEEAQPPPSQPRSIWATLDDLTT